MLKKTLLVASALTMVSSTITEQPEQRPRIYFPREIKREYSNTTVTKPGPPPPPQITATEMSSSSKRDLLSNLISEILSSADTSSVSKPTAGTERSSDLTPKIPPSATEKKTETEPTASTDSAIIIGPTGIVSSGNPVLSKTLTTSSSTGTELAVSTTLPKVQSTTSVVETMPSVNDTASETLPTVTGTLSSIVSTTLSTGSSGPPVITSGTDLTSIGTQLSTRLGEPPNVTSDDTLSHSKTQLSTQSTDSAILTSIESSLSHTPLPTQSVISSVLTSGLVFSPSPTTQLPIQSSDSSIVTTGGPLDPINTMLTSLLSSALSKVTPPPQSVTQNTTVVEPVKTESPTPTDTTGFLTSILPPLSKSSSTNTTGVELTSKTTSVVPDLTTKTIEPIISMSIPIISTDVPIVNTTATSTATLTATSITSSLSTGVTATATAVNTTSTDVSSTTVESVTSVVTPTGSVNLTATSTATAITVTNDTASSLPTALTSTPSTSVPVENSTILVSSTEATPIRQTEVSTSTTTLRSSITQIPDTTIRPTATVTNTDKNSDNWLPTTILIDVTSVTFTQPSATSTGTASQGLPTTIPKALSPEGAKHPVLEDSVPCQIGFRRELNYIFVYNNPTAAAQILNFLPRALSYASSIDGSPGLTVNQTQIDQLVPYETQSTSGYVTTIARFNYPRDRLSQLQADLLIPKSRLYTNPDPVIRNFTSYIDPEILLNGTMISSGPNGGDTTGSGGSGPGSGPGSGGNDAFGSTNNHQSSGQKAAMAGIAVGAVGLSVMYGAAMFIVARRFKRKRQAHRRANSVSSSQASSDMQYHGNGSPALMNGGLMSARDFSSYDGTGGRDSHASGGQSARTANISAPVATENSLGWN